METRLWCQDSFCSWTTSEVSRNYEITNFLKFFFSIKACFIFFFFYLSAFFVSSKIKAHEGNIIKIILYFHLYVGIFCICHNSAFPRIILWNFMDWKHEIYLQQQKIVQVKNLYDKIIAGKAEGLHFYQVWIRKQQSSNAGGRFAKGKFQSWNTS